MDSLSLWCYKKFAAKNSACNFNDSFETELNFDENSNQVYKLPSIFKANDNTKREDINYGYLKEPVNLKRNSNFIESPSVLTNGVVSMKVCDYLNTVDKTYHKNKVKNKRANLHLTTSTLGDQVDIYESDIRNIRIKNYAKKFLMKSETLDSEFSKSDMFFSSKTKLKPVSSLIENKNKDTQNKHISPLQRLVVQNREYPWFNLEKYLNKAIPTNPRNSPIIFVEVEKPKY
jgi:hypothetical protein